MASKKKGAAKKKAAKKKAAKKKAAASKAVVASKDGKRRTPLSGKKIMKLVKDNPRRAGTHGHASFALIKSGMSVDSYLNKGGRMQDLKWELERDRLKLV